MTKKSALIRMVGGFIAFVGISYIISPSKNPMTGAPDRDTGTLLFTFWLIASGAGVFFHKKWAFILYGAGAAFLPITMIIKGFQFGYDWGVIVIIPIIVAVMGGIPFALLWTRRDKFLPSDLWK
jgi:hypothetical protein